MHGITSGFTADSGQKAAIAGKPRRCVSNTMNEKKEIIKKGTFLYDGSVTTDIQIVKTNIRYCSGDYEDEPDYRDDVEGEFFNIEFGSTTEREKFVSGSLSHTSLEEAVFEAEKATNFTVTWDQ